MEIQTVHFKEEKTESKKEKMGNPLMVNEIQQLPDTLSKPPFSFEQLIFCKSDTTSGLNNNNIEIGRQPLFIHAMHRGYAM